MSRIWLCAKVLVLLCALAISAGCLSSRAPRSAYQERYEARLAGVELPTDEEIQAVEAGEDSFAEPVQKVWDAFLDLASQSWGLLQVRDDPSGGHRALIVAGPGASAWQGRNLVVDRWLAVSLQPGQQQRSTRVSIAFVSPATGRAAPIDQDAPPRNFTSGRGTAVSLAASADLLRALEASFAEQRYLQRFAPGQPAEPRRAAERTATVATPETSSPQDRRGNLDSANYRRTSYLLHFPELERRIGKIVRDLAAAVGRPGREPRAFIVDDIAPTSEMEYNGDFFLTTGLLDQAANFDELAGVVAHEMAHFYLNHGAARPKDLHRAEVSQYVLGFSILAAVATAVFVSQAADEKRRALHPADSGNNKKVILSGLAAGLAYVAGVGLANQTGAELANGVGHLSGRREELEADDYGAELLWAAGYDYRGMLSYLEHSRSRLADKRKTP